MPCDCFGSRAMACWIVNFYAYRRSSARDRVVPETQSLVRLSDDEGVCTLQKPRGPFAFVATYNEEKACAKCGSSG